MGPPKGHSLPPIFGPCLLWINGWMDQDGTWYGGRLRPRRHCVRWGPSSPKGAQLQFSSRVCSGQTAGLIKMPLCMQVVDLGPGHIVLDSTPSPERGQLLFGPCLLWPNGRPSQLLLSSCSWLLQSMSSECFFLLTGWSS